jgi:hypothetical protein
MFWWIHTRKLAMERVSLVSFVVLLCTEAILDIVAYPVGAPINPFYISFIGDLKDRRSTGKDCFTPDEMGQMHSFLEELLSYQPNRFEATGCFLQV